MDDLDALDFFKDPALIEDPYPYFARLRSQCPVRREPHQGVLMVTGYDEATAVYSDPETFSSCNAVTGPFPGFPVPLEGDDVSDLIEQHRDSLPFSDQLPCFDPPKHTAHRALTMRLITPKRLKENEAFMWRLADQQVDEFFGEGRCEFIAEYASPFTMLVIADLLGVPESDHGSFRQNLAPSGLGAGDRQALEHKPLEYLYERFTHYIEECRAHPRDDVLSGLANATFPDGTTTAISDAALIASNLFAAGQETTVRLLSSALLLIAEDAELQQLLRAERDRIPNFVEETLRIESPIKGDFRLARRPTTVGGVDVPAGTTLMVLNGAANRDARVFAEPDRFIVDRPNARHHLAFGFGIHTCLGAPLARAEARVSIERLLDRTRDIRVSEANHGRAGERRYEYIPTFILRGVKRLHLEFTPA